jgi:hypothetical protein
MGRDLDRAKRRRLRPEWWALASVALATAATSGCAGGSSGDPGPEDAEASGYLMFNRAALSAGYGFDGLDDDELLVPIELDAGEVVDIESPHGDIKVTVKADELVYFDGDDDPARGILGKDFERDRLTVAGTEQAARRLARMVGGDFEPGVGADTFDVVAVDAYAEAAASWAPDELFELRPVARDEVAESADEPAEPPSLLPGAALSGRRAGMGPMLLDAHLVDPFAALARAPVSCDDPITGVWVSREYYDTYKDWYMFTLTIDRSGGDLNRLVGTIDSRSWSGRGDTEEPTECGALPIGRWGSEFDWTVEMEAAGKVDGRRFEFGGTRWSPRTARCGFAPGEGSYNLDQFSGRVVDGKWLQSLNNDGDRSIDDPHTFRRVGCLSR